MGMLQADEPFTRLLTQGMVIKDGAKMSKSKGNVVDPDEMVKAYGADTVRLFMLFAAPPDVDLEWSEKGVAGVHRFLGRLWRLGLSVSEQAAGAEPYKGGADLPAELKDLYAKVHETIKKVTEDALGRYQFNTAIAAVMELVNQISLVVQNQDISEHASRSAVLKEAMQTAVVLISPMAPHVADELWQRLGHDEYLIDYPWPEYDEKAMVKDEKLVVVQVSGKVRAKLTLPSDADDEALKAAALADEHVMKFVGGKQIRKIIVVQGKLVNLVV